MSSEIGLIGLGVMGKSLSRNLAQKGFKISIFNRHVAGKEEDVAVKFQRKHQELKEAEPFDDLGEFVKSLETPRKIILMVNAGPTVDLVLNDLKQFLERHPDECPPKKRCHGHNFLKNDLHLSLMQR